MNKKVFCFSGQGSHYYKMGLDLYNNDLTFKTWMNRLDEIVKPIIHESVISVLYDNKYKKSDLFNDIRITHPAIFMFEYSLYKLFLERKIYPDYLMGASLGEFTAAAAAEVINYEEAVKMVAKQAEVIEALCDKAGMMALLYKTDYFDDLKKDHPDIELASINADNHFIISGLESSLDRIEIILKRNNIIHQKLAVSYAFHSSLIDPAKDQYISYLNAVTFNKPVIPCVSCVTGGYISDAGSFHPAYFWDVCRQPILLKKAVGNIEKSGAFLYLDAGPAGTLANLIKLNLPASSGSAVQTAISPFGNDLANIERAVRMAGF